MQIGNKPYHQKMILPRAKTPTLIIKYNYPHENISYSRRTLLCYIKHKV